MSALREQTQKAVKWLEKGAICVCSRQEGSPWTP